MLYPLLNKKEADDTAMSQELDDGSIGEESGTKSDDSEKGLRLTNYFAPSAFGLTFSCNKSTDKIKINISFSVYEPSSDNGTKKSGGGNKWKRSAKNISND